MSVALLAEVKVKAVVTFEPYLLDRHFSTAIALYVLLHCLPRLYNELNLMLVSVASNFKVLEWPGEIAVLAETEMVAVSADKASSDDWPLVTTHTLVLVMGSQAIC